MVEKRRSEFTHGRYCARVAMANLGITPAAVPKGVDRAPVWPTGLIGSITHSGAAAAAAVAYSANFRSIGLDIETSEPLTPEITALICRPAENPQNDGTRAKILFSIKESIYKCLYPMTRTYIDFLEMEVFYDADTQKFSAHSNISAFPNELTACLEGCCATESGFVLSTAWIK
jgi:4'-phosphopantetheinyl transferase EntD